MIKLNYPEFWQKKSFISYLLLPFSLIYLLLGQLRSTLAKPVILPAYTICLGNATIGGTGKTQVAIWLAKAMAKRGKKCVILCKGYGGNFTTPMIVDSSMSPRLVGDEALELCIYATTIVSKKIPDAISILKKLEPSFIIVDDGMQNPNFAKDFILMVIDGSRGFGNGVLFPAGPLREFADKAKARSDAVVVTDSVGHVSDIDGYRATIIPEVGLNTLDKYYAFAGIGNPERFFEVLKAAGANLVGTQTFPDHYKYLDSDIELLMIKANLAGAKLITTRKDYVKLRSLGNKIMSFDVGLEIDDGETLLERILSSANH